ncbi:MAG: AAA family ATPase, partial [Proteobacteria bacterium]|nr:AAA family ATPase [Pseudomonadota bacterium]
MTKPLALAAPLTFDNNEIYMRFPTSTPSFKSLRKNNFYYVDKTRYLYNLTEEENYFFLSRPRRFGKSLLVSTLHYLFEGEKELFKGLYIY